MSIADLWGRSRQSFSGFWSVRDMRERTMLIAAAMVVLLGLVYALLIDPALTGREQMSRSLPLLREQVAHLQALSQQAAALSGKHLTTVAAISKESIEAALARNGLKPQSVVLTGDYAKVQLTAASFAATLAWLDDMQKAALLYVVDANIVALAQADQVDVTLTLRQARNE